MAVHININVNDFLASKRKLLSDDYPRAVAKGLENVSRGLKDFEMHNTRAKFNLNTEWVPNNIMMFPKSDGQCKRIMADVRTKGYAFASVFSSKYIEFFTLHEDGGQKTPYASSAPSDKGIALTMPINSMNRSTKTRTGKTRSRYQPIKLLEESQNNGWVKGSKHPGERGKGRRLPFIMTSKSGNTFIARRLTASAKKKSERGGGLEILYNFKKEAYIKPTWDFEKGGRQYLLNLGRKRFIQGFQSFSP